MRFSIPESLASTCRNDPERWAWLEGLPDKLRELEARWSLVIGEPFDGAEVSCAWVAPTVLADGVAAVLKLGMPHMEGEQEIVGLRFWNGTPTVQIFAGDEQWNAMLLERCLPGTALREFPEPEQDVIIAGLLRRLWRKPVEPHPFRPLSMMVEEWRTQTLAQAANWPDHGSVQAGLTAFQQLLKSTVAPALLATDLHAGNVLRSQREPWLAIDPKPFVGDPAYDLTQHLLNSLDRLHADPHSTVNRLAELAGVDQERVRLWTFARLAAAPRDDWNDDSLTIASALES